MQRYELVTVTAPAAKPAGPKRFYLGGQVYEGWTNVPDRYKVHRPEADAWRDADRSALLLQVVGDGRRRAVGAWAALFVALFATSSEAAARHVLLLQSLDRGNLTLDPFTGKLPHRARAAVRRAGDLHPARGEPDGVRGEPGEARRRLPARRVRRPAEARPRDDPRRPGGGVRPEIPPAALPGIAAPLRLPSTAGSWKALPWPRTRPRWRWTTISRRRSRTSCSCSRRPHRVFMVTGSGPHRPVLAAGDANGSSAGSGTASPSSGRTSSPSTRSCGVSLRCLPARRSSSSPSAPTPREARTRRSGCSRRSTPRRTRPCSAPTVAQMGHGIVGGRLMSVDELGARVRRRRPPPPGGESPGAIRIPPGGRTGGLRLARAEAVERRREPPAGGQHRPLPRARRLGALQVGHPGRRVGAARPGGAHRLPAGQPRRRRRGAGLARERRPLPCPR